MKKIYKIIICLLIIILLSCTTVSASNDTRDDNNTINHQINKTNTITNNQIIKNNTKSTKNVDNKKKIIITTPIAPAIKEPTKPACHPSQPTTDPTNIKDKNSPKL